MKSGYTADIGLEVHAELQTKAKMFCACPVVDLTITPPNTAVCPICSGMPGTLPVVNSQAVDDALRVALSLECEIHKTNRFARKNYFYPDLPKGYQISQYEFPLGTNGHLPVWMEEGWLNVHIRRVHLEEDTGKLTHITEPDDHKYTLLDLNRAGIPLLEIVSEPDMHTIEQVRSYTHSLRTLLQYLKVNSGDLEKGVMRFEANVSVRPSDSKNLGTRVEIKNLNSFRIMTAAITYEIDRQIAQLKAGQTITQETLGWDKIIQATYSQRTKEEAHDYRYFPEPDLPPLKITQGQISDNLNLLPERPDRRFRRFVADFGLTTDQAHRLIQDQAVADFFEETLTYMEQPDADLAAKWVLGELFGLINASNQSIEEIRFTPRSLASLLNKLQNRVVNPFTAKSILSQMFSSGQAPEKIIQTEALNQISDQETLERLIDHILAANPEEVQAYHNGKTGLRDWFFGQVMQQTRHQANPDVVKKILEEKL